eukprot:10863122-Prorocentrum_lima.AAC.1
MTSSLVGSEMCIRDRSMANSWHYWPSVMILVKKEAWYRLLLTTADLRTCLLYTSDAADDM